MSLHYYKLLLLSTEGSSINVIMIISKMCKSRKSTMLSTEDSRNGIQSMSFASKLCITPQNTHIPPPPHTHTNNRQKVLSTEDSYGYNLIETLYRSLGESTMNVAIMINEHKDFVLGLR